MGNDEIFDAKSPIKGVPLFFNLERIFFAILALVFFAFGMTLKEYFTFCLVAFLVILLLLILNIYAIWEYTRMKYVLTDSSIRIIPEKKLINIPGLVHMPGEIPYSLIKKIEIIPAPKNIFEALFTSIRPKKLLDEGQSLWSITSTGILRDVVLINTDYRTGIWKSTFVLSPENKEEFVKKLNEKMKSK